MTGFRNGWVIFDAHDHVMSIAHVTPTTHIGFEALDTMLADLNGDRLGGVLERLAGVFCELSQRLSDEPIRLFDHLFLSLTPRADIPARASLANILAPIANAPPRISQTLARDEAVIVASPMLRLSQRLDFSFLMEIAARRGQDHLLALAQRTALDQAICALIADRGQAAVLRALIGNRSAKISDSAFATITARASAQRDLQEALKLRSDLPAKDRARLEALATPEPTWRERSASNDAELLAAINQGDWMATAEILAGYTRVTPSAIYATLALEEIDPILACARAASMDWDTTQVLLVRRLGARATAKRLQDAHHSFKTLSRDSAARALRFLALKARMLQGNSAA